jgi:PEP-CTERM motif
MKRNTLSAIIGLSIGATVVAPTAQANVYTVFAVTPEPSWLDTGIDANPTATYDFTVINPSTLWSAGVNTPFPRDSTANGINPIPPPPNGYGALTMLGYTFNFGALVGEDATHFFLIGTGPTILSGLTGEIHVGYWDDDYPDNSGTQTLSITAVPEPSTWALMLAGFVGLGLAAFGRSRKARTASALA